MTQDLKKGELLSDWRHVVGDQKEWRGTVFTLVEELNVRSEEPEKQWKDEWKKRKEGSVMPGSMWLCNIGGCAFGAQSKAGLVNHQRQKHGP